MMWPAAWSPARRRFCCVRYSIAKWTPLSSRPGIGGRAPRSHRRTARWRRTAAQAGRPASRCRFDAGPELDALGRHQREPAVEEALLQLELGNAVAQQPADAVGALEHRDLMPGLLSSWAAASPAGPEPTTATRLPVRTAGGRARIHPSRSVLDDRQLDRLIVTGSSLIPSTHDAFARRRTQPAGPLGEVVRRVQPVDRGLPPLVVDEVVPVGNHVAERASLVAERDAAVHAAGALVAHLLLGLAQIHFLPVADALLDRAGLGLGALDLDEPCGLTH